MRIAIPSLLLLAALARADFDATHWRFRRALQVENAGQVNAVTLDRAVYAGAQPDLNDVRVIDSRAGAVEQNELAPEILDRSVVPGAGLQLTLDLGRQAKHNRLRIATAEKNFRTKVRIETSADGRSWAVARAEGYVFDFTETSRSISVLSVDYPVSTRRYVRATFFGWMKTDIVAGAWLTDYQVRPAAWQTLAVANPIRTEERGTSVLVLDLGVALPHSRLTLETDAPLFHRACEMEASSNRRDWFYIGQGVVYRFGDQQSLNLEFAELHERYFRLRIFNGDDQPVPVRRVSFETIERRVKFLPQAAGEYELRYGNPAARAPSYDLGAILARRAPAAEIQLAAGAEQLNPGYRPAPAPRRPWTEQHPEMLYTVLAAAVLGMGFVTVRFLMGVKKAA